jgi:hypothetical protein
VYHCSVENAIAPHANWCTICSQRFGSCPARQGLVADGPHQLRTLEQEFDGDILCVLLKKR